MVTVAPLYACSAYAHVADHIPAKPSPLQVPTLGRQLFAGQRPFTQSCVSKRLSMHSVHDEVALKDEPHALYTSLHTCQVSHVSLFGTW